jgi:hypothetical protein
VSYWTQQLPGWEISPGRPGFPTPIILRDAFAGSWEFRPAGTEESRRAEITPKICENLVKKPGFGQKSAKNPNLGRFPQSRA